MDMHTQLGSRLPLTRHLLAPSHPSTLAPSHGRIRRDSSDMGGSEPVSRVLAKGDGGGQTPQTADDIIVASRSPSNVRTRDKVFRRARLDNTTPTPDDESGARLPPHPRASPRNRSGLNSGAESPSLSTGSGGKLGRHLPRTASGIEAHHEVCWAPPTKPRCAQPTHPHTHDDPDPPPLFYPPHPSPFPRSTPSFLHFSAPSITTLTPPYAS